MSLERTAVPPGARAKELGGAVGVSVAHKLGVRGHVTCRELIVSCLGLDINEGIVINHEGLHVRKAGGHPLLISSK